MKRLLLAAILCLLAQPAGAQSYVRLYGGNNGANVPSPASPSNPIPVTIGGGSGVIQIEGIDQSTKTGPSNPLPVTSASNPLGAIVTTSAAVTAGDVTVTLSNISRHLTIKTDPLAAVIYLRFRGGAATTADFRLEPGSAVSLDLSYQVTAFHYFGAATAGIISVLAY